MATPSNCRLPVLPYGLRREARRERHAARRRRGVDGRHDSRRVEPGVAHGLGGAGAVDGRLAPRRARLPHVVSVRLHRADALEFPAERGRHARAHAAEARANRTPLGCSIARSPKGSKRLGDFQHDDGGWGWWKTDENHPFMTAYALYGLHRSEARRLPNRGIPGPERRPRAGGDVRGLPARRTGSQGLHGLRPATRGAGSRRGQLPWRPRSGRNAHLPARSGAQRVVGRARADVVLRPRAAAADSRRRPRTRAATSWRRRSSPRRRPRASCRGGRSIAIRCSSTSPIRASRSRRPRCRRWPAAIRATRCSIAPSAG